MNDQSSIKGAAGRPLSIRVIGLGGAGTSAVRHMSGCDFSGIAFSVLDTSNRDLLPGPVVNKYLLGQRRFRGLGAGGDPEVGRTAAEDDVAEMKALCAEADLVFIIAGLGGGTGTGASPVLARVAREAGALVLALVTLPFEFEGVRRQEQAEEGLKTLKLAADAVICLPNQKVLQLIDEKTSVLETFKITGDLLAQGVRGIWQMLSRRGLIDVDFAYLYSVVRGRRAESYFATARAQGENRVREVIEKIVNSPLLDGGQRLHEADAVLVTLLGGPDLTIAEVNRVMEQVNRYIEKGRLIMGAAIDESCSGSLEITVIASCHGVIEEELTPPAPAANNPEQAPEIDTSFFSRTEEANSPSRFVPPAPNFTPEKTGAFLANQRAKAGRSGRKNASRWRQSQLPLEVISKGRFEKSQPTIHRGEDLDVPTYIRRGIALN